MKKFLLTILPGIVFFNYLHAQNTFPSTGNAGIGTLSPYTWLHIVVPSTKTNTSVTLGNNAASFLSTSDENNPFGLRTMLLGGSTIGNRSATLQTTDWASQDGGNIFLQPFAGSVGIGTTDAQGNRFLVNGVTRFIGDVQIDNPNKLYFTTDHTTFMQSVGSHQFKIGLSADVKTQISMYPNKILLGSDTEGQGFTVADGGYSAINWVPSTSNMFHIMGAGSQTHLLLSRQDGTDFFKVTDQALTTTFASIGNNGEGRFGEGSNIGSAVLQANSTTMGFLSPRMTNTQRDAIVSPVEGLEIYSTTDHAKQVYNGTTWQMVGAGSSGTLAAGSVIFAGSGGNFSQDNSNLFWDATSHRLGIGIATPEARLHIMDASDSRPGGISAPTSAVLKLSRPGTAFQAYQESAEFRIGHGGPNVWGSKIELFVNGASNQNNIPDQQVMTWNYDGHVGIGTIIPQANLEVNNGSYSNGNQLMISGLEHDRYNGIMSQTVSTGQTVFSLGTTSNYTSFAQTLNLYTGNVGIGIIIPKTKLQVNTANSGTGYIDWVAGNFGAASGDRVVMGLMDGTATIGAHNNGLSAWADLAINPNGGNVAIGTTDPQGYKLAVNGNAIANSVTVKAYPWHDYVFENSYTPMPLAELENYVKQNHHLPEIPSAGDVAKTGLDLGQINGLLLKKVEELTLYMIDKDKQVIKQKEQLQVQQSQINTQQEKLNAQQAQLNVLAKQLEELSKKLNK